MSGAWPRGRSVRPDRCRRGRRALDRSQSARSAGAGVGRVPRAESRAPGAVSGLPRSDADQRSGRFPKANFGNLGELPEVPQRALEMLELALYGEFRYSIGSG